MFFDGKKLESFDHEERHFVKHTNKERIYIEICHKKFFTRCHEPNGSVKYIIRKKEFSEKSGSKWVTKRRVWCEKVE